MTPSLHALAQPLLTALLRDLSALRLALERQENGALLVDAGLDAVGGLEAGRRIAELCMAGLGHVSLAGLGPVPNWPSNVMVHTSQPVLACLGSQYAGWSLSSGEGREAFHALGSGPARALALKEPLFQELGYRDEADETCLVLETSRRPPLEIIDRIARACRVAPERLTLILTPTQSLAGTVQVVARVLEVALHKAHALDFPLERIVDGMGGAPLPPPAADFITAMGRTNDAVLYGGQVHLYVRGSEEAARDLARALPSSASRDYGRPFAEVFEAYKRDFFKIDPMLFSPGCVTVSALDSGNSFTFGQVDTALIERSFGRAP